MLGDQEAGEMRSVHGDVAASPCCASKVEEAARDGRPLIAGEARVMPVKPAWAGPALTAPMSTPANGPTPRIWPTLFRSPLGSSNLTPPSVWLRPRLVVPSPTNWLNVTVDGAETATVHAALLSAVSAAACAVCAASGPAMRAAARASVPFERDRTKSLFPQSQSHNLPRLGVLSR